MSSLFIQLGISLNLSNLFGDVYINITINSALEIPAYVLLYFSLEKIGRRNTFIGTFSLTSAFCGLAMILLVIGGQYLFLKLQQQTFHKTIFSKFSFNKFRLYYALVLSIFCKKQLLIFVLRIRV